MVISFYFRPETFRNSEVTDVTKTDTFALGLIFFALIKKSNKFYDRNTNNFVKAALENAYLTETELFGFQDCFGYSEEFNNVIRQMLTFDTESRPTPGIDI